MKIVSFRSQISLKLLLGLLMVSPGLYAMDAERKITLEQREELQRAMALGTIEKIEQQLSGVTNIDAFFNTHHMTPLHDINDPKAIQLLLKRKADVNARHKDERFPLLSQCYFIGHSRTDNALACTSVLLDQPTIDVNLLTGGTRNTALHVLVEPETYSIKYVPLVVKLFDRGADPFIINAYYKTIVDLLRAKLGKGNDAVVKATIDAWKEHCTKITTMLSVYINRDPSGMVISYVGNLEEAYKPERAPWLKQIFG